MDKIVIFAQNMGRELKRQGMKQNALALKIDRTPQTISDYIKYGQTNGKSGKKLSLESVLLIADALNMSLDELFGLHTAKDSVRPSINTVGEAIEALLWLLDELPSSYTPEMETVFSSLNIGIEHDAINSFFLKRDKMWRLWTTEQVIDEDLYNTWLHAEIEKMRSIDLLSSARPVSAFSDLFEDNDGGSPF